MKTKEGETGAVYDYKEKWIPVVRCDRCGTVSWGTDVSLNRLVTMNRDYQYCEDCGETVFTVGLIKQASGKNRKWFARRWTKIQFNSFKPI